jgi:hypothetical protein
MNLIGLLHSFVLGKTASYRCNAYDDAAIAAELICYLQTGIPPEGTQPVHLRAVHFIETTPEDDRHQRLAVQAYTLYWINGYGNIVFSRFLERLMGLKPPVRESSFEAHETGAINLWFWVRPIIKMDVSDVKTYVKEAADIELTLPYRDLVLEAVRVQEANIEQNRLTCSLLKSGATTGHPKVNRLRELANHVSHPRIFLFSAAETQLNASTWDRLGVWLVQLKLRA